MFAESTYLLSRARRPVSSWEQRPQGWGRSRLRLGDDTLERDTGTGSRPLRPVGVEPPPASLSTASSLTHLVSPRPSASWPPKLTSKRNAGIHPVSPLQSSCLPPSRDSPRTKAVVGLPSACPVRRLQSLIVRGGREEESRVQTGVSATGLVDTRHVSPGPPVPLCHTCSSRCSRCCQVGGLWRIMKVRNPRACVGDGGEEELGGGGFRGGPGVHRVGLAIVQNSNLFFAPLGFTPFEK